MPHPSCSSTSRGATSRRFRLALVVAAGVWVAASCTDGTDEGPAVAGVPDGASEAVEDEAESDAALPDVAASDGGRVVSLPWSLAATSPDGTRLLVQTTTFGGVASGCTRFEGWTVEESAGRVLVVANLWTTDEERACTGEGVAPVHLVELDQPLAERQLDGCGRSDCVRADEDLFGAPAVGVADGSVVVSLSTGSLILDSDGNSQSGPDLGHVWRFHPHGGLVVAEGDELIAFDPATSEVEWSLDHGVLVDSAVLRCADVGDHHDIEAADPRTGVVIWRADVRCGSHVAVTDDGLVHVLTNDPEVDGGLTHHVLDGATGAVLRTAPFNDGLNDQVAGVDGLVSGGGVVVGGGHQADVVVLETSGEERHRSPERLGPPIGVIGDLAFFDRGARLTAVDVRTGEVAWVGRGLALSIALTEETIFTIIGNGVASIDPLSGEILWSAPLTPAASHSVASDGSVVAVASVLAAAAFDATTGAELWVAPLPFVDVR